MPGQLKSPVDSPKVSFFMSDFFLGGGRLRNSFQSSQHLLYSLRIVAAIFFGLQLNVIKACLLHNRQIPCRLSHL